MRKQSVEKFSQLPKFSLDRPPLPPHHALILTLLCHMTAHGSNLDASSPQPVLLLHPPPPHPLALRKKSHTDPTSSRL
jgi:hypothetical protein